GIENYYAKAVYELGLPGLFVVAGFFVAIIIVSFNVHRTARFREVRCWASAFAAFFVVMSLNSFKGWLVDLDPVNVYYWVFCGLLLKLPALQAGVLRVRAPQRPVPNGSAKNPSADSSQHPCPIRSMLSQCV